MTLDIKNAWNFEFRPKLSELPPVLYVNFLAKMYQGLKSIKGDKAILIFSGLVAENKNGRNSFKN